MCARARACRLTLPSGGHDLFPYSFKTTKKVVRDRKKTGKFNFKKRRKRGVGG